MIQVKRVYEPVKKQDGTRIFIERLWPRGIKKEDAAIDLWLKDLAPSADLRKWFSHDPKKWESFKKRYWKELRRNKTAVTTLRERLEKGTVTLVFASRDEQHNVAVALKEFIEGNL